VSSDALEPFDVLWEAEGLPESSLTVELERIHGGGLGLEEPRVYANFVSTLDGVVAVPPLPRSNRIVAADSAADRFLMGLLRAFADVVLIGSGTLRHSPTGTWLPEKVYPPAADDFRELRRLRGRPAAPEVAVLSGHGSVDPQHPLFATGAVLLTSHGGAARLEGRLPDATTVLALGAAPVLEPRRVVDALHERGHRLVLSEAGPHTFGALLAGGLVDELFLTVSPLLAGDAGPGSRYRLVEGADLVAERRRRRPLSVRRHGEHLFLRYAL
jgi:riboflavin biosynthesis pyrimidine reductase